MGCLLAVTLTEVKICFLLARVLIAVLNCVWSAVLLMAVWIGCLLARIFIKIQTGYLLAMYCCWPSIDNSTECFVVG